MSTQKRVAYAPIVADDGTPGTVVLAIEAIGKMSVADMLRMAENKRQELIREYDPDTFPNLKIEDVQFLSYTIFKAECPLAFAAYVLKLPVNERIRAGLSDDVVDSWYE